MIQRGKAELQARIQDVLSGRTKFGLVVVFDESGMADFSKGVTTVQVRDALLEYARDLVVYEGDR